MTKYAEAVEMVLHGASYREALEAFNLPSTGRLHMLCKQAGVKSRPRGPKPSPPNRKMLEAVTLIRRGFTYREVSKRTGISVGAIHKAVNWRAS